ncbi:MAG: DNA (cytosine-5)-methyltransferase 1 [Parvicella sp.]|jgi:DNA (cytosine-5)-methyltransferase 1
MNKHIQTSLFEEVLTGNSYIEFTKALGLSTKNPTPDKFGKALYKWSKSELKKPVNTLCLFSGAGGLDIGFHDAGFNIVECVELEAKFVKSLEANKLSGKYLKNTSIVCQDIREYEPDLDVEIDFIIGGPPCQSFSKAGIRAAGARGTKDSRGTLFEEYVRILKKLQPKGFLFENVSGILSSEKGEAMKKIVKAFQDEGYKLSYRLLDAADYGVPQNRERLILVGHKNSHFKFPSPTHGVDSLNQLDYFTAGNALSKVKQEDTEYEGLNGRFGHLLKDVPPGLNYSFFTDRMGHPNPVFAWRSKFSDFLYKADPELPIRTLKASGGQYTGPFHWDARPFSVDELKRLQTFPDDYAIIGGKGLAAKQIGNSVPPQFARILAVSVLNQYFDVTMPFEINYLVSNQELSFRKVKSLRTKHYWEKAQKAIDLLDDNELKVFKSREYAARLDRLRVVEDSENSGIKIKFATSINQWSFSLQNDEKEEKFRIKISHIKGEPLFEDVRFINLIGFDWQLSSLLILWKAFEKEIIDNQVRADLVQLNGYYQYNPIFKIEVHKRDKDIPKKLKSRWTFLENLFEDSENGKIRDVNELSALYDIKVDEVVSILKELKNIGFEIRNHNTNPEIPENHYLIPYKFPSLNNLSLQLKTAL